MLQPLLAGQERGGGEQVGRAQGHGAATRPAREGGRQYQPVHPVGVGQGQFLGDHAAEASAEDAGLLDAGMVQDGQNVLGHGGGGEGSRWAVGGADAAVVDGDDLEPAGQPVGHRLPTPAPDPDPLDQDERPAATADVVGDAYRAVVSESGRGHAGGRRPAPGDGDGGPSDRAAGLPEDRPEAADPEKRHRHTNSCRWVSS
jgi:hypothetical protein